MFKNLLNFFEIATLPKSEWFSIYQRYWSQILIAQIKDLNEDCVKILRSYISYVSRSKLSKSVTRSEKLVIKKRYSRAGFGRAGSSGTFGFLAPGTGAAYG